MIEDPPLPKFYLLGLTHGDTESEDFDTRKAVYYFQRCLEEKIAKAHSCIWELHFFSVMSL